MSQPTYHRCLADDYPDAVTNKDLLDALEQLGQLASRNPELRLHHNHGIRARNLGQEQAMFIILRGATDLAADLYGAGTLK